MKRGHPGNRVQDSGRCKVRAKAGRHHLPSRSRGSGATRGSGYGTAGRREIRGNPEIHHSASPMDKKVRGDPDIPHRHEPEDAVPGDARGGVEGGAGGASVSGTPGAEQPEPLKEMRGGETRSSIAGLPPEDAVPGDARGHIVGATGQAGLGTLSQAKQVALKDRRAGLPATRSPVKPEDAERGCPGNVIGGPGQRKLDAREIRET